MDWYYWLLNALSTLHAALHNDHFSVLLDNASLKLASKTSGIHTLQSEWRMSYSLVPSGLLQSPETDSSYLLIVYRSSRLSAVKICMTPSLLPVASRVPLELHVRVCACGFISVNLSVAADRCVTVPSWSTPNFDRPALVGEADLRRIVIERDTPGSTSALTSLLRRVHLTLVIESRRRSHVSKLLSGATATTVLPSGLNLMAKHLAPVSLAECAVSSPGLVFRI